MSLSRRFHGAASIITGASAALTSSGYCWPPSRSLIERTSRPEDVGQDYIDGARTSDDWRRASFRARARALIARYKAFGRSAPATDDMEHRLWRSGRRLARA